MVRSLDALLPDADHVVLAAPATSRTRHLLDAAAFAQMRKGVHVVNIARGSLIDQDALRVALDDGTVAMASLDTVDPEPLPAGHWLYTHPRVLLTAHVSWYTPQLLQSAVEILVDNLGRYERGEPLRHVVDPDEGY
jgi:phosphoglycerate dehydrogenase-like enzyme